MTSRSVLVLNWHGIGRPEHPLDPGEDGTWVSTATFEGVVDAVVGRTDVMITFDDGNVSDVDIALPLLVERGLAAAFFPLAGRLGEPGRVDEAGVRKLVEAGMTVGSHGWAHRDWRRLRGTEIAEEHQDALDRLSHVTGQSVDTVAIPFGSYDRSVLARLRAAGVTRAYTSDGGRTDPDRWLQSRFSVRSTTTVDDVHSLLNRRPTAAARARYAAATLVKRHRPEPRLRPSG